MTKKIIRTKVEEACWVHSLDGSTVEEAIIFLQRLDPDLEMELDYGYEGIDRGDLYDVREETDEEHVKRLEREAYEAAEEVRKAEVRERQRQEDFEKKQAQLKLQNLALHAYLEKHKGNPAIGDLENLFLAMMNLERAGHGEKSTQALREMMERLENN